MSKTRNITDINAYSGYAYGINSSGVKKQVVVYATNLDEAIQKIKNAYGQNYTASLAPVNDVLH